MTVLQHACEDVCPVHRHLRCRRHRGHDEPHRVRFVGLVIEWRLVPGDAPITRDTIIIPNAHGGAA